MGGLYRSHELQCRFLLELWTQQVGYSEATLDGFKKKISGKHFTAELIEDIDDKIASLRTTSGRSRKVKDEGNLVVIN